jgi:DNA-binding MarR family transcriptional regulator
LQYKAAIPDAEQLRKNVLSYLKQHDINADIFIKKSLTYLLVSKVINSRFLLSPKSTKEIQALLKEKFDAKFTSARVSDALDRLTKKGLIEKVRIESNPKVLYKKV